MSLETYTKQIVTWTGINGDVPEHVKYHDLMEELKKNTEIRRIQRYVAEHIILVLPKVEDQTLDKVVALLDIKYGRSRTEKIQECVEDILKFKEDQYEEDGELILTIKEIRQREIDLKITQYN